MTDKCTGLVFQAHSSQYNEKEDDHPDFFGLFVCPFLRTEPEQLLGEVLANRKLFLVQITDHRRLNPDDDWGMNESLKAQIDEQGYGLKLTKLNARPIALQ